MNPLYFIFIIASFALGFYFCHRDYFFDTSSMFDLIFIFGGMMFFIGFTGGSLFMIEIGLLLFSFDAGVLACSISLFIKERSDRDQER